MMQTLNISTFPVLGQSLIEASAGTGKTFTIASLYSRLLLGHQTGLPPQGCDRILVVTFTNAATEELRGRIRDRVRQNLEDLLRIQAGGQAQDATFGQWVADCLHTNDYRFAEIAGLADWFRLNLAQMDNAAVFTIHGFCQRMLRQFAFDSGVMFSAELVLDSASYLRQACEDVWRNGQYPLQRQQVACLQTWFPTPAALQERIRGWLSRSGLTFIPKRDETFDFASFWRVAEQRFEAIQQAWNGHDSAHPALDSRQLVNLIHDSGLSGTYYRKTLLPNWADALQCWLAQPMSLDLPVNLERFGRDYIQNPQHLKKNGVVPQHALFEAVQAFLDHQQPLQVQLLQSWFVQVQARYFELLERAGVMSPDDLLRLLARALEGERAEALAVQIRSLFPIALIDEFQDTDPQQFNIFSRIYPAQLAAVDNTVADKNLSEKAEPVWGLSAIGDPKQAIYAFRGADIFTYIGARRGLPAKRIFTLDTNWRSHSLLVNAVNHLFEQHPAPFVFDQDIPFVSVKAAGQHDHNAFVMADAQGQWQPQLPLQLWVDTEERTLAQARRHCARQCAERIHVLLTGAGKLGAMPIVAADIAVLVRSHFQAELVRQALSQLHIGSVFLSRDSVFASREALDLLSWLTAVAEPGNERVIRNALATETHGYSAARLDQLLTSEPLWEAELVRIDEYHQCWLQKGVMAAVLLWLEHDDRALQLRLLDQGDRRLTNLLHLGELLQQASRRLRGHQALLRWLTDQVFDDRSRDEAQLRLETDANLVSIVTIHKSKGLEYPLVFLPFLWSDNFDADKSGTARYFDNKLGVVVNLDPDDNARALQARDSRAEAMRLLYVALTRPRQGCFIWLSNGLSYKKPVIAQSALGVLLQVEQLGSDLSGADARLLQQQGIGLLPLPDWQPGPLSLHDDSVPTLQARRFERTLYDSWRVSSFTGLARDRFAGVENLEDSIDEQLVLSADESGLRPDEWLSASQPLSGVSALDIDSARLQANTVLAAPVSAPIAVNAQGQGEFWVDDLPDIDPGVLPAAAISFPRGANAGTCLHSILEHWDFVDATALQTLVLREMGRYGLLPVDSRQQGEEVEAVCLWLQQVAALPLQTAYGAFSLATIGRQQRLDELEFCLPIRPLRAPTLNSLLDSERSDVDGHALNFSPVSGYLKGFIDLVVCVEGRYYLMDYKSNWLGDLPADYGPERLDQAMAAHHYDLQSWIYTLALDALLQQRLPGYQPQQHLGGVLYLFVRGMSRFAPGGVYYRALDVEALARWKASILPVSLVQDGHPDTEHKELL